MDNIYTIVREVGMQVQETEDAFIFSRLSDFVKDTMHIEVSKQELIEAISLYRLKKEANEKYGCSNISDDWNTATAQSTYLHNAYMRGYQDGMNKAHERFEKCLDEMKEGR